MSAMTQKTTLLLFYQVTLMSIVLDKKKNTELHLMIQSKKDISITPAMAPMKNMQNKEKKTPLHLAISLKLSPSVIKELITEENINIQDKQKNTALHYAYMNDLKSKAVVNLLLNNGANVEIKNKKKLIPVLLSRSDLARKQSIFNNIENTEVLDILNSIHFYKGENGAKKINGYLHKNKGQILPEDSGLSVVHHIKNLLRVSKTGENDSRYNKYFYRGIRSDQVTLLKQKYKNKTSDKTLTSMHFSSITPKKSVARQFTNIQYGYGDDTCCIMKFKIPDDILRIDMRKLEKQGFLINDTERELLLEPNLKWVIKSKSGDTYKMTLSKI
jgi:hypothetical protein